MADATNVERLAHLRLRFEQVETIRLRACSLARDAATGHPDDFYLPSLIDELSSLEEALCDVRRTVDQLGFSDSDACCV
jgi:hypothetical protein